MTSIKAARPACGVDAVSEPREDCLAGELDDFSDSNFPHAIQAAVPRRLDYPRRYRELPEGWPRDAGLIAELDRIKERLAMERPRAREEAVRDFIEDWATTIDELGACADDLGGELSLEASAWRRALHAFNSWREAA